MLRLRVGCHLPQRAFERLTAASYVLCMNSRSVSSGETALNGDSSYFNRGFHVITMRWGKVYSLDVFEDSQEVARGLAVQAAASKRPLPNKLLANYLRSADPTDKERIYSIARMGTSEPVRRPT